MDNDPKYTPATPDDEPMQDTPQAEEDVERPTKMVRPEGLDDVIEEQQRERDIFDIADALNADSAVETNNTRTRPVSDKAVDILDERPEGATPVVPWVVQLRLIGATDMINLMMNEGTIVLGRLSSKSPNPPDVDLNPYGALHRGVSRRHAQMEPTREAIMLTDLGSRNGTILNGRRLIAQKPVPLRDGDSISLGDLQMQIRFNVMPRQIAERSSFGQGKQLLIVEEDMDVAFAYRVLFEQCGFRVSVTDDPAELQLILNQIRPDLVICDMFLQDMQTSRSVEVLTVVRERLDDTVPVMVVSDMTGGHHRQKALEEGASRFIDKPVHADKLLDSARELIVKDG